jgi:hypothetical protein
MLATARLAVKPREPLDFDLRNMWEIVPSHPNNSSCR